MRDLKDYVGMEFKRVGDRTWGWILQKNKEGRFCLVSARGTGCVLTYIKGDDSWDFRNEEKWEVKEEQGDFWNV